MEYFMNLKSKFLIILIAFCILFLITGVSASDETEDMQLIQDLGEVDNADVCQEVDDESLKDDSIDSTNTSFKDLFNDIEGAKGTFNMEHDYVFKEDEENETGIMHINELVINGYGHVIDGANIGVFLAFYNINDTEGNKYPINITINDVVFKNFKSGVLSFSKGTSILNNVSFVNCTCQKSIIIGTAQDATLILNNSNINLINQDGFIWSTRSRIIINNTNISGIGGRNSLIELNRGQLIIENSRFDNFSSNNGVIINYKGDYFRLKNSKFLNSYANFNGGAIIAKYFPIQNKTTSEDIPSDSILIENCEFLNVSSANDGGAIFIDLDSGSNHIKKTLNIVNSNFTDCKSRFGGAIAILGGCLNIENSKFINNSAGYEGGAVYSSWTDVAITGSDLSKNTASRNAGAIYFDKGKLTIKSSNFSTNKALKTGTDVANAVYAYDVDAYLADSTFDNGGIAVYADFASDSKIENITKNDDIFLLDNKNYIVSVESNGIKLNLVNNSIVVEKLPYNFNSSAFGWTSPVRKQGDNDDCWAFATVASLESSLLKSTGKLYNLSENYVQQLELKYSRYGDMRISLTGFGYSGLGYALSWIGALPSDKPYDDRGVIGDTDLADERIHLQDAIIILGGIMNNIDLVKQTILKCGAVTVQLIFDELNDTLITEGDDIAVMEHEIHFISLVGWDDNWVDDVPGTNQTTGGWLCKDSLSGYHYLSYYDFWFEGIDYYAIIPQNPVIGYLFENNIDYHVNYQTDLTGLAGFDENYTYYSNEFTSKYSELIGAVGTYFNESGIDYSFDIYVNNVKVHTQNGISEFGGFKTIILNKYIPVNAGDKFKVVFKNINLPYQAYSRQHYMSGMSFISSDGKSWKDITLENKTVCLKVYTVRDDTKIINNKNIVVDYDGGSYFSVKVVTADGRAVGAGAVIKFNINGKTYTVKTDDNGVAKIKITQLPKKYTITTNYRGHTVKNTVTVKQVLTASKVSVKKTAKKFVLQAKLKINGKLVKGKIIKFKFNGKTYKAKTNKKGIAKVTLKKKVIKKLKKGKKYTVKVTYLKDTIKTTVKVK